MSPLTAPPVRVGVLHGRRAWLEALERLVEVGLGQPVAVAHTALDWVKGAVARGEVDLVLLGLDDTFGPEHVAELRAMENPPAVVVIGEREDPDLLVSAIRAGASGWLRPTASARELEQAMIGVAHGETWLPPDLTTIVLQRLLSDERKRTTSSDQLAVLSSRELEVLECLAQGLPRSDIAERLTLSSHTVRTHINHILRKLDVHTTLAAVLVLRQTRIPGQRSGD